METNVLDFKSRNVNQEIEFVSTYLMSVRKGRDSPAASTLKAAMLHQLIYDSFKFI